ncbi:hypothetical protein DL98DRAFT_287825 [Cadophora sp. DSE1049]|nr:hypothetical protein DL98DRAFT_287825 [Cadophora sp. DSE1049]
MAVERCISFLVYANKYMLGPVEDHVHEPLKRALISCEETVFSGTHIKRVFEATENGSSLRVLITDAALSFGGAREGRYQEQEIEVAGFAAEMLQQMRNCILRVRWRDPLRVPKPGEESERYD